MAHGYPDYGVGAPKKTTYTLSDMAELAARLGSIVTFDRRGDVVWLDDFEAGLEKWAPVIVGTGAALTNSPEAARSGGFSAKLTLGDAIDDQTGFVKYMGLPTLSKVGFEISFTIASALSHLGWRIFMLDGTYQHEAYIRYYESGSELKYLDQNNVYQHLAYIGNLWHASYCWHTAKLVVDHINHKYVRFLINENAIDMSALPYYHPLSGVSPVYSFRYYAANGIIGNRSVYADDAIITQNEP